MAFIHCTNRTSSTLTVQLEDLDPTWDKGNRTIYWYAVVANTNVEPWQDYYPESSYKTYSTLKSTDGVKCGYEIGGSCQLTGLTTNTKYHIKALVYSDIYDYEIISLYGEATPMVLGDAPTVNDFTIETTAGSLNVYFYLEIEGGSRFYWQLYWKRAGDYTWYTAIDRVVKTYEGNYGVYTYNQTFTDGPWNFGEEYHFKVEVRSPNHDDVIYEKTQVIAFTDVPPRPNNWTWSTAIKSGETRAFDGKEIHPVTASEWRLFVARVNEFRDYCRLGAYTFTQVSPGDELKSAYNQAVAAIRAMGYSTANDLPDIDSSTVLSPTLFRNLETALAKIP